MLHCRARFLIQDIRDRRAASRIRVVRNCEVRVLLVAVEEDCDVVEAGCNVTVVCSKDGRPWEMAIAAHVQCDLEIIALEMS